MAELVPINYISTAKQDLFDIIIGRKVPEDAQVPTWYLIKGDYETIYKMMVNREMLFGAKVDCFSDGSQDIMLWVELSFAFVPDETVNGKPVIIFGSENDLKYIDCNNAIYWNNADIPFDKKDDAPTDNTGGMVVDPDGPGGPTK